MESDTEQFYDCSPKSPTRPTSLGLTDRYDYLSINDDGLLTPNSTVNSITADYTRQMLLSQNRKHNTDQIASELISATTITTTSTPPRQALAEKQEQLGDSRYFSCSDFFAQPVTNSDFSRDDSIRSSLSRKKRLPTQPHLKVRTLPANNNGLRSGAIGIDRAHSMKPIKKLLNADDLSVETERVDQPQSAPTSPRQSTIDQWVEKTCAPPPQPAEGDSLESKSMTGSLSSSHSSIASTASAMARRAKSIGSLLSKTFRKPRKHSLPIQEKTASTDELGEVTCKVKDAKSLPKTSRRHLDGMVKRQTLVVKAAVIVMKFNHDGNLLATAGKDAFVYVWVLNRFKHQFNRKSMEISNNMEQLLAQEQIENETGPFCSVPLRKYFGHTDHIVDLTWSEKSGDNWLLSASIDKSVRLWHVTKDEAIATFNYDEIPKCIMFDPKDNCRFIVGFLDGKIQVWNIPNRKTTHIYQVDSPRKNGAAISALCFLVNNRRGGEEGIICGTMDGRCIVLELRRGAFAYHTELLVATESGVSVSGIELVPHDPSQIVVTSTDNRIRCYSLLDNSILCRYKGFSNRNNMFIRGVMSPDGLYIASGSEDGHVYSWEKEQLKSSLKNKRDKNDFYQYIKCHSTPVHAVQFVPRPSLIGASCTLGLVSSSERGQVCVFTKSRSANKNAKFLNSTLTVDQA